MKTLLEQQEVLLRMMAKFPENSSIFGLYKFNYERIIRHTEESIADIAI